MNIKLEYILIITNKNYLYTINNILQYSSRSSKIISTNNYILNKKKHLISATNTILILDISTLKILEHHKKVESINNIKKILLMPLAYNIEFQLNNITYINLPLHSSKILNLINIIETDVK